MPRSPIPDLGFPISDFPSQISGVKSPIFGFPFSVFRFPFSLILLFLLASPASAHKLHVFALANGTTIEGDVYAAGNEPIRNAAVTVLGPHGEKLGETTTDEAGKFRFVARQRIEHTFVVDTDDGHSAKYKVAAEELPTSLAAGTTEKEKPLGATTRPASDLLPSGGHALPAGVDMAALKQELEAVRTQLVQLRKEIDAYEQKVRLHDIFGGIGVILGLMGTSFYFLGVLHKEKAKKAKQVVNHFD